MRLDASRAELESGIEADMTGFAEDAIRVSPGEDDLKQAFDFNPAFFGGLFPTAGFEVSSTTGRTRVSDKPNRPGVITGTLYVYDVAMPERGARSRGQDRTSRAKKNARRIRDEILERMFADPTYAARAEVRETRSSIYNDFGFPMLDVAGSNILWVDRTEIVFSL